MKVIISERAEKDFKKLPKFVQIAITGKIRLIEADQPTVSKKLQSYKNIFRFRVGQYRVVYQQTKTNAFIFLIRHRKDVYRTMKEILS